MALSPTAQKFANYCRGASRTLKYLRSSVSTVRQLSNLEKPSPSKKESDETLKAKLCDELFGVRVADIAGKESYSALRLTAFPIKAVDLTPDSAYYKEHAEIQTAEIYAKDKKRTDYNKIIPRCEPDSGSGPGPGTCPSRKKKRDTCPSKRNTCPSKRPKKPKPDNVCKPRKKKPKCSQVRAMSTFSSDLSTIKDNNKYTIGEDPSDPRKDPVTFPDAPYRPDEEPTNPQRIPSGDPHEPSESDPTTPKTTPT